MKFIVIGCGRMGAGLAQSLHQRQHKVVVVDNDVEAFKRLGTSFRGQRIIGIGFDRDILLQADIERADGLAAVTSSDEANIVVARLASQVFHVPHVVARMYDPRKAEVYRRLGLQTIDPVLWGVNRIADILCSSQLETVTSLGGGEVDVIQLDAPPSLVNRTVRELTILGEIHVIAISRGGKTFLPTSGTAFLQGDVLHLAILPAAVDRLKSLLGWS